MNSTVHFGKFIRNKLPKVDLKSSAWFNFTFRLIPGSELIPSSSAFIYQKAGRNMSIKVDHRKRSR